MIVAIVTSYLPYKLYSYVVPGSHMLSKSSAPDSKLSEIACQVEPLAVEIKSAQDTSWNTNWPAADTRIINLSDGSVQYAL